jgi:hypothetical protein
VALWHRLLCARVRYLRHATPQRHSTLIPSLPVPPMISLAGSRTRSSCSCIEGNSCLGALLFPSVSGRSVPRGQPSAEPGTVMERGTTQMVPASRQHPETGELGCGLKHQRCPRTIVRPRNYLDQPPDERLRPGCVAGHFWRLGAKRDTRDPRFWPPARADSMGAAS